MFFRREIMPASHHIRLASLCAGICVAATLANAQVVINEVYSNPPGSGSVDDRWEYVEIYGPAGLNLTGWAISVNSGGQDPDGNNIPGPLATGTSGEELSEIDEAWSLDGLTIGANGLLCLYNSAGSSLQLAQFNAQTTRRTFAASHIPTTDTAGRIINDGSVTYSLVRRRPFHALNTAGVSLYDGQLATSLPVGVNFPSTVRYSFRKDAGIDVNFDGRFDLNGIGFFVDSGIPFPAETPLNSEAGIAPDPIATVEPLQVVDDLAVSHLGGKEYTRSQQQEISETPGFNPDALSRIFYFGSNPARGSIFSAGVMIPTRTADEEFIYGDIGSVANNDYSDPSISPVPPAPPKGPTDQNGPTYNAAGVLDPQGTFLLNDINVTAFNVTPGNFNDVNSSGQGGINITQFRFVPGDFNFDGVVNCDEKALIEIASSESWSLDMTETKVRENGTVTTADDVQYTGFRFQGREFNGVLAMIRKNLLDGSTGEWTSAQVIQSGAIVAWGGVVTTADLAAFNALFPTLDCAPACPACPADYNQDGGVTGDDIAAFFADFEAGSGCADTNVDGGITGDDIASFFSVFETGGC